METNEVYHVDGKYLFDVRFTEEEIVMLGSALRSLLAGNRKRLSEDPCFRELWQVIVCQYANYV